MAWRDRVQATRAIEPGSVLRTSFAIMGRNAVPFTVLTLLTFLPVILYYAWVITITVTENHEMLGWLVANLQALQIGETALTLLCTWALSGMLVYGVYQHMRGRPVRAGDCLTVGLRRLPAVIGTSMLVSLVTFVGFALCLVPGVMLSCQLWVALPATVIENAGPSEAYKRSSVLTNGSRWAIFAVVFVIGAARGLVTLAADGALDNAVPGLLGIELFVRLVVLLFFSTWTAVAPVVGYYDIRRAREGLEVDDLAAIFD